MKSNTTVKKWGNSLAVRLPKSIAEDLKLADSSQLIITSNGKSATIAPITSAKVSLDQLVSGITPENQHQPEDWGKPVGKEVW